MFGKKGHFTQIENSFIKSNKISDSAFRTYLLLRSFAYGNNKVFPSLKTLSKIRNKSIKSITNHLNELRKKGLIRTKKRGYSASNEYQFIGVPLKLVKKYKLNKEDYYYTRMKKSSHQYGNKFQPNNTKINNTKINNIPFGNLKGLEKMREVLIKRKIMPP